MVISQIIFGIPRITKKESSWMLNDTPVIKLFQNNQKYYVYDTFSNIIFSISKAQYIELNRLIQYGIKKYTNLKNDEPAYKDIVHMINSGYFKDCFISSVEHPDSDKLKDLVSRCLNYMILQTTCDCNFDCLYCPYSNNVPFERSHSSKDMSIETAKQAVDFMFDHSKDAPSVIIGFYGGEPLLNFSLIKQVVEYSKTKFEIKPVEYSITTNASLLTEDIIKFIVQNNFRVLISMDGPIELQNRHRRYRGDLRGTYSNVEKNINFLKNYNLKYFNENVRFNSVVMPDEDPQEVIAFFDSFGVSIEKLNLLPVNLRGVDYIYSSFMQHKDLSKYDEYFSKKDCEDIIKKYKDKNCSKGKLHHNGPCIPMLSRFFVNCNGDLFSCEKIKESDSVKFGSVYQSNSLNYELMHEFLNIGKMTEAECRKCYAFRLCSMCATSCFDCEKNALTANQKLSACKAVKKRVDDFLLQYVKSKE